MVTMSTRTSGRSRKPSSKAAAAAAESTAPSNDDPTTTDSTSINIKVEAPPTPVAAEPVVVAVPAPALAPPLAPPVVAVQPASSPPRVDVTAVAAAVAAASAAMPMNVLFSETAAAAADDQLISPPPIPTTATGTATATSTPKSSKKGQNQGHSSATLTPATVEYLKAWMMSPDHISHPYPNDQEKAQIIMDTGINAKQLTTWFSNNRKRFWKPKMDSEGRNYTTLGNTLSAQTIDYLKAWMMAPDHIVHPYPSEEEKVVIMRDTGIDKKQLTTWFSNNRKRFWKPKMDELRKNHGLGAKDELTPEMLASVTIVSMPMPEFGIGNAGTGAGITTSAEDTMALEDAVNSMVDETGAMEEEEGGVLPPLDHPDVVVGDLEDHQYQHQMGVHVHHHSEDVDVAAAASGGGGGVHVHHHPEQEEEENNVLASHHQDEFVIKEDDGHAGIQEDGMGSNKRQKTEFVAL